MLRLPGNRNQRKKDFTRRGGPESAGFGTASGKERNKSTALQCKVSCLKLDEITGSRKNKSTRRTADALVFASELDLPTHVPVTLLKGVAKNILLPSQKNLEDYMCC